MIRTRAHSVVAGCALAATMVLAASCSTGVRHVVEPGENLYRIGKAYGFHYAELAEINDIEAPYTIRVGQRIFIPGAEKQLPVTIITPRSVEKPRPRVAVKPKPTTPRPKAPTPRGAKVPSPAPVVSKPQRQVAAPVHVGAKTKVPVASSNGFVWPIAGTLTSRFGPRKEGHHDGIDIAAELGRPIQAARAGRVIFSDKLSGYGNVVIVEHADGFTTVYAHNQRNLVKKGTTVARGAEIALVGRTGRADGTHLHFEIRRHNVARDPIKYLPKL